MQVITPGSTVRAPFTTLVAIALPVGWVLLSVPLVLDVPVEPFVLGTLVLGLVLPTVLLARRQPDFDGRRLLRDCFRLPRPLALTVPAFLLIPSTTWLVAWVFDVETALDGGLLLSLALANVVSSVLIVNLWEEMVWAGVIQRGAMARWGYVPGSLVTAALFAGLHLPLALYDVEDAVGLVDNVARLVVAGVGLRLLVGAFDRWSKGSILTLAVLHATFNASGELLDSDHDWIRYLVTLALGMVALAIVSREARNGR